MLSVVRREVTGQMENACMILGGGVGWGEGGVSPRLLDWHFLISKQRT